MSRHFQWLTHWYQHAYHCCAHRAQKDLILRQRANKTKTDKMEVKSAKWYLKCNSSSSFTSSITGLCSYIWIQSCTQSSGSVPLYTWAVKLISVQTRKKINKVIPRSVSILCCSNSVYFHVWFLLTVYARENSTLLKYLARKDFVL